MVVDRIGARTCLLALSSISCLGEVVTSLGIQSESWPIALTGRFIYGLGLESLFVANEAFLATWFEKERLGMALGASGAASYIGFLLSYVLSPIAANKMSVAFSFWLGTMIMGFGVLASCIIFVFCRESTIPSVEQVIGSPTSNFQMPTTVSAETTRNGERTRRDEPGLGCRPSVGPFLRKFGVAFWLLCISCLLQYSMVRPFVNTASGLLLERNLLVQPSDNCVLAKPDQCTVGELAPTGGNPSTDAATGEMCPSEAKYAPVIPSSLNISTNDESPWDTTPYVFITLEASDIDCSDNFWSEACTSDYCDKQASATERAGVLMTIPFIVTVSTTFLFGYYCFDRAGLRLEMIVCAPILIAFSLALFAFLRSSPIAPLIIMGFGFSITVSSVWPSVPFTVDRNMVGTAFGLMTSVQNIGNALVPLLVAAIHNVNQRYLPEVATMFLIGALLAIAVGIALLSVDRRNRGTLRTRGVHFTLGARRDNSNHCDPQALEGELP